MQNHGIVDKNNNNPLEDLGQTILLSELFGGPYINCRRYSPVLYTIKTLGTEFLFRKLNKTIMILQNILGHGTRDKDTQKNFNPVPDQRDILMDRELRVNFICCSEI